MGKQTVRLDTLINFLIGNGDMHLNTTLALTNPQDEIALPQVSRIPIRFDLSRLEDRHTSGAMLAD
jgi:hypothetical protein